MQKPSSALVYLCLACALAVSVPLASLEAGIARTTDHATAAFLAQRDGNYAACASNADKARRESGANYTIHRLFAACTVNAAEADRKTIGEAAYADRLTEAVAALQLLRTTPGAYHQPKANNVITLTIQNLQARIAEARKPGPVN